MKIAEIVELARALHAAQPDPSNVEAHAVWVKTVDHVTRGVIPAHLDSRFVKACEDGALLRLVSKRAF
jgi:hypothetical protein